MLLLAIETATDHSSVALFEGEVEVASWRERTHQDLLRRLASEVGGVMGRAGRAFSALDLIAVGLGPGSFTSLRVGLATAKGLSLAWDVPLVGVPTLAALTWQARAQFIDLACPVLDARRGEVYAGLFRVEGEAVTRVGEEFVADAPTLAARLREAGEPVTLLGETDLPPVQEAVAVPDPRFPILDSWASPDAAAIAHLAALHFAQSGPDDPDALKPIYVRKSYAEEKFDIDLGLR
jgi:tRNA threonylcarbamoyladenosine biosynthesis protein TsaB